MLKDLECYFHCTHFLLYCLPPKVIPILLVQSQGFLLRCGHLDPKFVCHLVVSLVDCCYDSLSLLKTWVVHQENAGSSLVPIASAYSATSIGYDSFMSLNLSHEVDLSFPLYVEMPSSCGLLFVGFAVECNILVVLANWLVVLSVINNVIHGYLQRHIEYTCILQ